MRHLDSEQSSPYCHLLTDRQYLLCDLRQPRAPVLATDTCLGRVGQSASWLWGRARLQDEDWIVTGDTWGQLRLSVVDGPSHPMLSGQFNQELLQRRRVARARILL